MYLSVLVLSTYRNKAMQAQVPHQTTSTKMNESIQNNSLRTSETSSVGKIIHLK